MKKCELYEKCGKKLKCLACSHKCVISEGETGNCGVRKNIKGELYLLVYGRPVAVHKDPIEKKPLYKFMPGTSIFSIGTVGCNFKCDFCQNYDISQFRKYTSRITGKKLMPKKAVRKAIDSGCKSIAYTYNEPTIFIEFVRDVARIAKKKGLKNVMVTNGFMTKEALDYVSDYIDAMNIDLKSLKKEFYQGICNARLGPVLSTIKRAHKKGIHLEITTLLIPGKNDSEQEIEKIAKFIASVSKSIPWHISRFFPHYKMRNKSPTPIQKLKQAEKIGKKYLNNVYLGNI